MPAHDKIDYLEHATTDLLATKAFFARVFGWTFTDYGPNYSAFSRAEAGIDGGFYPGESVVGAAQGGPLAVFYSADLEATQGRVLAAGGELIKPVFSFPGGRRFHFREPGGNEWAVWSDRGC